ncbi:hypothetical protein J3F80_002675 [Coemansia sp. RSA 2526]|nr:hypothetical protein J3F80_002675 [Coemansia sp. RSA 2526]
MINTIPIDVQIIEWSLVTYLQLATHIDMAVSLTLLEKLHNLNQIVFYNFDMVNVPSEAFEIADDAPQNTRLSPLNTKLVKLMLDYDRPEYTDELVMAVIKYLALRLTSLKVFGAWIAFDAALASFIDNYKATYPHLVDLVFKLGMVE